MRKSSTTVVILIFCCLSKVTGQFVVNDFLTRPVTNSELNVVAEQIAYFESNNFRSPWVREVEFRMRVTSLEEGLTDYRLRLSPLNPFEIKANKQHEELMGKQLELQRKVSLSELLKSRYTDLVRLISLQERIKQEEQSQDLLEKLKIIASDDQVDLVKVDLDVTKGKLRLIDLIGEYESLQNEIRASYPFVGEFSIQLNDLISNEQIRSELSDANNLVFTNILYENRKLEYDIESSELNIRRKESFSNLGFVQAEFRERRGDSFDERFGIQFGFNLPITNPDRPDLQRRKLDLIAEREDLSSIKYELDQEKREIEDQLDRLLRKWDLLKEKSQEIQQLIELNSPDPELVFELINYRLELSLRNSNVTYSILLMYLEWLDFNGILAEKPLRNQLSPTKEEIQLDF